MFLTKTIVTSCETCLCLKIVFGYNGLPGVRMKSMFVVYFSHVLPALCPWRHLYALEQMSVSSWLDWSRLPHRYTSSSGTSDVNEVFSTSQAGSERQI